MSPDENGTNSSDSSDRLNDISDLEKELLTEPTKKTTKQIVFTVLAISMFFGAFNLTILLDSVFINKFLCSPINLACTGDSSHPNNIAATQIFSILKVIMITTFMFALIIGGAISDDLRTRFGNRVPMIMFGAIIAGIGYMILPIVVRGSNQPLLIITAALVYILIYTGLGFALAPEYALISELFTKEERGWAGLGFAGIGLIGTVFGVLLQTFFINPYSDALENVPWVTIGFIAGSFLILMGFLTFIGTPKKNPPFPSDGVVQDIINTPKYLFQLGAGNEANKDFLLMFIVGILWGGGGFIISSFLPNLLENLNISGGTSIDAISLLFIMGISGAIFAGPVGVLIAKLGKVKSGMAGSLVLGFFTFMIAQSFSWNDGFIFILAITAGFGTIFITAVNISLPADLVPRGKEGQFMGLFTVAANLSAPLVGIIAAFILTSADDAIFGLATIFLMTTVFYFGAVFILGFMHYESQLEGEYQLFYRRYLIAKGYISDKAKYTALRVSSSFRVKRS
jgi:MFS family permease